MDESVDDEVNDILAVDGTHFRSKENEYSSKFGEHGVQESHEVVILNEGNKHENPSQYFIDILDGNNMGRIGSSGHASSSPRCIDDNEIMVRELTFKNYNTRNLAIVGIQGNIERVQTRPNQWKSLCQIAGGSGKGSLQRETADKDKSSTLVNSLEGEEDKLFTDFLEQNQKYTNETHNLANGNSQSNDDKSVLNHMLLSSGGIRTKIVSNSGFSQYFIKGTLKGKGTIHRGLTTRELGNEYLDHTHSDCANISLGDSPSTDSGVPPVTYEDGISLREWLKVRSYKLTKTESLSIFKQIVDLVDSSHSQGIVLLDLRPSCFKLLRSNQAVYLGKSVFTESTKNVIDRDVPEPEQDQLKRPLKNTMNNTVDYNAKKLKLGHPMNATRRWSQFPPGSSVRSAQNNNADISWPHGSVNDVNEVHKFNSQIKFSSPQLSTNPQPFLTSGSCMLEATWYTSPEQIKKGRCTFSSNIYCLGVLLFELIGISDPGSGRSHAAAMQDLSHRILPPSFLSENPKEAGFCLWLLHPEPSSRPTVREILQSEILGGKKDSRDEVLSSIIEEDSESELLVYFLSLLEEQKQNDASKLVEELKCIEADIQEVHKRQTKQSSVSFSSHASFSVSGSRYIHMNGMKSKSIQQLESAYFSMRSKIQPSSNDVRMCRNGQFSNNPENNYMKEIKGVIKSENSDGLGGFFDGLCKYARYNKLRVCGLIRNGDFNSSANVICSLSFDRDEEYLAAGGVSKKIKIYEYNSLLNDSVDVHYPVLEMSNNSKLSCVCWNSYIRNYLATSDYDGVVKLWDATSGQGFFHLSEHNERAWSVDFSRMDPTKLASGSDDRLVKLWSINEKNSIGTIKNNANVCSVQFSPSSSHLLAYSSADYRIYCYDLRNVSIPWRILVGHEKAVSYVKFLDAETLVSASTDNTLKIWDLKKTSADSLSTSACILTLRGHTNEKNFVGLSVADGYISCGSETNEVFTYYKSHPMPITSCKFGSIDPISGKETDDDRGQFVSSVCWRRKSNVVVAANSTGCIKLLEMV
ncbi:unnamed protein product [Cuscuta campestris]|uniref:Protein kinase domain-containing protein n=1 Tax=Cuscuta campestris TaxID=132261 RepID=A0A484KQT3_9ASTE|nr:unnamed protein product [Cuscuta campestris]